MNGNNDPPPVASRQGWIVVSGKGLCPILGRNRGSRREKMPVPPVILKISAPAHTSQLRP